jgi:hypothetical protein
MSTIAAAMDTIEEITTVEENLQESMEKIVEGTQAEQSAEVTEAEADANKTILALDTVTDLIEKVPALISTL